MWCVDNGCRLRRKEFPRISLYRPNITSTHKRLTFYFLISIQLSLSSFSIDFWYRHFPCLVYESSQECYAQERTISCRRNYPALWTTITSCWLISLQGYQGNSWFGVFSIVGTFYEPTESHTLGQISNFTATFSPIGIFPSKIGLQTGHYWLSSPINRSTRGILGHIVDLAKQRQPL